MFAGEECKKIFNEMTNGLCQRSMNSEDIRTTSLLSPSLPKKKEEECKKLHPKIESNCPPEKSYREFSTPSSAVSDGSYKTANSDYSFPSSGYHSSTPVNNGSLTGRSNRDLKKKSASSTDKPFLPSGTSSTEAPRWCEGQSESSPPPVSSNVVKDEAAIERQLDLDTRIELLLKGQAGVGLESGFCNMFRKSYDIGEDLIMMPKTDGSLLSNGGVPSPPREPPLPPPPPPPPPPEEDTDKPLSRPPSPFLSKEVYLSCHQRALELALKAKEEEKMQTTKFLEKVIKGIYQLLFPPSVLFFANSFLSSSRLMLVIFYSSNSGRKPL